VGDCAVAGEDHVAGVQPTAEEAPPAGGEAARPVIAGPAALSELLWRRAEPPFELGPSELHLMYT
jgi:hypothetical protein